MRPHAFITLLWLMINLIALEQDPNRSNLFIANCFLCIANIVFFIKKWSENG